MSTRSMSTSQWTSRELRGRDGVLLSAIAQRRSARALLRVLLAKRDVADAAPRIRSRIASTSCSSLEREVRVERRRKANQADVKLARPVAQSAPDAIRSSPRKRARSSSC